MKSKPSYCAQEQIEITHQEKAVLKALHEVGTWKTTRWLADKANVSWIVAHNFLEKLEKRGWIYHATRGTREYWKGQLA